MEDFYKFPRTSHVMNMGSATRDDLVMDKKDLIKFLSHKNVVLEEKVDGANLGITINEESHYVTYESGTQWKRLKEWQIEKQADLYSILQPHLVLFGEWCYSKHSIHYTRLPDHFLAFDIIRQSTLYDGPMEGLYLRIESEGEDRKLMQRGKIVREDFLGPVGENEDVVHWSKRELVKNIVVYN